jgi:HEAT repeat protein
MLHGAKLLMLLLAQAAPADVARDLGSSDPAVRLGAVEAVVETGHPDAEKLLLRALKDDDWEVASIAATGLGALRVRKAVEPLLDRALEGPVRGLRRAAGEALALVDPLEAYEELVKELGGDEAVRACEAIASLGPALESLSAVKLKTKELDGLLESRQAGLRRAAARALVAMAGPARGARLKAFLEDQDVALRAAAIEAAGASRDARVFEALARQYERPALPDFLARRVRAALREVCLANPDQREAFLGVLAKLAQGGAVPVLVARQLGHLAEERGGARALEPEKALAALQPHLANAEADVRAAAAASCARIASGEALYAVAQLTHSDVDPRVRRIALGVVARARGPKHDATRALLLERLAEDADARVRETAAAHLGVRGKSDVIPVLAAALRDPDWRVMTSAAVALGKTQDDAAAQPLVELYRDGAKDWRQRASAVAGLMRSRTHAAVPVLISALTDEEKLVARTAHEFLRQVSKLDSPPEPGPWTKWWVENEKRVVLSLSEEVLERRKKYGYGEARSSEELFRLAYTGVDVLVLQSRGDHIEDVLAALGIEHRRTSSGQVLSDGIHPQGVFVSNCTGEITADEAARLDWFVRAGGALFGSCWALQETIQDLEPGLVRKLETRGEVLGDAPAHPCEVSSRYLEGVFLPDSVPIYHLEGAHLIEVLDPEEVEVLVDSPPCAEAFGGANLAAWFSLGHGVVLDSANHFELQGFLSATVREPEERMAYAIDHLGLTYARLRELRKEKFWNKTASAAEHVKDLSVFRLITNFVWLKLLAEE